TPTLGYADGGRAMLVGDDPEVVEIVAIDAVASGTLTLSAATTQAWPAGTRVYPVRKGRFIKVPTLPRFTSDDSLFRVEFRCTEPMDFAGDLGSTTYRGAPVFERRPVWVEDP